MKKEEFKEKLKDGFDKFVISSKKAFGKAGNAVQDFSDKSVIRIEKKQFESKRANQYEKLGKYAAECFQKDSSATLSSSDQVVQEILAEIKKLDAEIKTREESLAAENSKKTSDETSEKEDSSESPESAEEKSAE